MKTTVTKQNWVKQFNKQFRFGKTNDFLRLGSIKEVKEFIEELIENVETKAVLEYIRNQRP